MQKMILLVGLLGLVGVRAQISQFGQCETINLMQNFVLNTFASGTWYEVGKGSNQNADCSSLQFTTADTIISVSNSSVVNNFLQTATGTATHTTGTAQLTLTLTSSTTPIAFWILASDYNNYAIAINCVNTSPTQRTVNVWQLGRAVNSYDTPATLTAANTALGTIGLNVDALTSIDHSTAACTQLPVIGAGQPVILDGQCATASIPVVQNFDVVAFTGTWHEISSYYSANAEGTCARANYDLVGGVVNVLNSQVLNQQLDSLNGTASLIGTDGSGRLSVILEGVPFAQELLVLSTDYIGYAVSYSCVNLPNNQRQVNSWILSRSRQISAESQTAVNSVIASLVDLNDAYYITTDQSDNGCFYFPTHQTGVPVVFPGQCDNTIAAVPSFDLTRFIGTWHEVEAYPKEQQTGTCVNHAFTSGTTTTLNLVSNQVINQALTSASGYVTLESTDGSGKFGLSLTISEQLTIEIPYWILATDYTSYALAYSCVNINPDYRAVNSWKLSRSQTLPAAAVTAINAAIEPVQVLDQQYFENVDQSEAGCFNYPEISAGDPVILLGQCGTVTPVANFQSAEFNGTWHEIARYASSRQSGNCAASQFTSAAQNTFTLTQTIIYNERQTVVSGTATLAADGSGTLTATLSDGAALTYTTTIHILDTDYIEFAVLYSCENVQGTNNRQIYSWKLSRSQLGFSQAANDRIAQVVASNVDLLERYYQTTGQTSVDCWYYPDFEEGEAIILPGACPAVSGVANFNPGAYLGTWYDTARYPISSQSGTCSRAEYTLVDGVITIRNTMVVNETLAVQNGIARLSGTGTGLLQVTFVLENGEEAVSSYYILATDYISYSLVYNCRNLADGTRQVFSWKLSRTPTLTTAANNAINNIISNTQGLFEDYYQTQNHTDQDCFYVPELVPGESVIFRGGCDQVTGMQGFNPSQYLGWWHEIQRYPSDGVFGQCTSANFVQTATNAIQVIESGVYNGVANDTTNVAVLNADGTISITRDGVTSLYVVIATDYNTYSLLYSCEEVLDSENTLQRRVWSAKHSKARSLSAAAESVMAPHIEDNPVLHQHLYESVSQSDTACFHYREDASEQVILPGQCDTTIPVQGEFDISRFAGTWYQIERYPYPQVSNDGTCVGARYTENDGGVTVQNWEVLDGVLNTKEGTASVNGAAMSITLPVEGSDETVTAVLHILVTDYEDFALTYTCVNINAFQRTVGAFKLSRSRALSSNGQFVINTHMNGREELHQPYFISISQHDDCDEPSSAFLYKSSIIIMLVCVVLQLVI